MLVLTRILFFWVIAINQCMAKESAIEDFEVGKQVITKTVQLDGKILPYQIFEIKPMADCQLTDVYFHYGEQVQENACLMRFQSDKLKDELTATRLNLIKLKQEHENNKNFDKNIDAIKLKDSLEKAREHYTLAKTHFKKSKSLYEKGFISQDELTQEKKSLKEAKRLLKSQKQAFYQLKESNDSALKVSRLKLIAEEKQLMHLKNIKRNLAVYSPFDGIVLPPMKEQNTQNEFSQVLVGKSVAAGDVVAVVAKISPFLVIAKADELDILNFQKDDTVSVTINTHSSGFMEPLLGRVLEIKPQLTGQHDRYQQSGFLVSVLVAPLDNQLQATFGMTAVIVAQKDTPIKGWALPKSAVFYENHHPYCWVKEKDNYEKQPLQLGIAGLDMVEVKIGIKRGDCVKINA